jgi:phosphorylcholine metabolism protein LicD
MSKNHPKLTDKNLLRANKVLFDVIDFFEKENIIYYLEGGTLLGIVRDGRLLPWDHDIDLSISVRDADLFAKNKKKLAKKGYRITEQKIHKDLGGFKKGDYRIFKVKKFLPSILKFFFPIFNRYMIVADIFVKANDENYTYWQAMEKIMRVDKKYYSSNELVEYMGRKIKAPLDYKGYLTEKYGDWSIPKKEWVCGKDEKTIVTDAYI